jgi:putative hemolysin
MSDLTDKFGTVAARDSAYDNPFRLNGPLRRAKPLGPLLLSIAERALAFERLANVYRQVRSSGSPGELARATLRNVQVEFEVASEQIELIPATGPAVVVANHPFGGLDGLYLLGLLLQRRGDVKLMANNLLHRIPELREAIIAVDVFGGTGAAQRNALSLRRAVAHARNGGMLVMFPAGEVSHVNLSSGCICDPEWNATAARLIRLSNAPVTPIHFGGSNSLAFQVAGLLHPRLRTAFLSRELLNKRNRRIPVKIGAPISVDSIRHIESDAALAEYLRLNTYLLDARPRRIENAKPRMQPIAAPSSARLVSEEIEALVKTQTLATNGESRVVFARAEQIPVALQEIGRLREVTFRAVGEGSGRSVDLDAFDTRYTHLIAWDDAHREIIGAYRIGHVDEIVAEHGCDGLYTHTLFSYGNAFVKRLGQALELGRSFVRIEYQKSYGPLLLLWRAIAAYVLLHPQYRVLFGPVSISGEYRPDSHALLVEFLKRHCYDTQLAKHVKPRHAFRNAGTLAALHGDLRPLSDLSAISNLLARIEPDGKEVPILLKQYLKLGGRLLGFNVDQSFGSCVDGLIVVDLLRTEPRTLQKYMGSAEAQNYLAHHKDFGSQVRPIAKVG